MVSKRPSENKISDGLFETIVLTYIACVQPDTIFFNA